jgi:chromosomal replication initiation ATPase DnaA
MATKIKPRVLIRKKDRIEYVLDGLCRYYDISRDELMRKTGHGKDCMRKRYAVKILRDEADCSLKDIMFAYNNKDEANIWFLYQRITEDMAYDKSMNQVYNNILNFLEI